MAAVAAGVLCAGGGTVVMAQRKASVAPVATWQQPVVTIDDRQAVAAAQQWNAPFLVRYGTIDPDIDVVRGVTTNDSTTGADVGGKAFPPTLDGDRITGCVILVHHRHVSDAVLAHEVGHCFGLHHSADPARLMHEVTGAPGSAVGVTDADRAALKSLYAGVKPKTRP